MNMILKRFLETTQMSKESNVTVDIRPNTGYDSYQELMHLFYNVVDAANRVSLLQFATTNDYESIDDIGAFIVHMNGTVDVVVYETDFDTDEESITARTYDVDDEDLYYYFHDEINTDWIAKCVIAYENSENHYELFTAENMEG